MRFIIMHKTSAQWESGAIPGPELIARVGTLLGEMAKAGVLLGAEWLRASAHGVRLRFAAGTRTVINGPFAISPSSVPTRAINSGPGIAPDSHCALVLCMMMNRMRFSSGPESRLPR